jgi:hypothetical protein
MFVLLPSRGLAQKGPARQAIEADGIIIEAGPLASGGGGGPS